VAKVSTPPERWVEAGLRALARGGPEAVRIDVLAKELGVTRGGFYWHFADRQALLDTMLDAWEKECVDDVMARVDARGGTGRDRLLSLFAIGVERPELLPLELTIRDWARRDDTVRSRVARVDDRRMAYLRQLFGEFVADPIDIEVRCMTITAVYLANDLIAATHEGHSRDEILLRGLERLLEDG
jgi:AcrR family transcriptional regulator